MTPRYEFRPLPTPLTTQEVADRAQRLADTLERRREKADEAKEVARGFKEDLAELDAQCETLAETVRKHVEIQTCKCEWAFDQASATKHLHRVDTGERIDSKPLSHDERQGTLAFIKGGADRRKAAAGDVFGDEHDEVGGIEDQHRDDPPEPPPAPKGRRKAKGEGASP